LYVSGPALIRQHLPTTRQQKAYGIWMMSCGIGISIGPVIGGALTSMLSWQWVFFINIPLCVAGIVFTFFIRNGSKQDAFKSDSSFDYYGAVLSFLFLAFIILGINGITRKTSSVLYSLAFISISVVIFVLFIRRETSFEKPVFQIRLFRNFNFMMANIGFFLFFIVNVGSRFLRPFYFENGRGLSTMTSGFLMMTAPLVMVLVSPLASMLTKRISLKAACFSGSFLLLVSMIFFSFWNKDTNIFLLVLPMIILGAGMGIYYPTASYVGMTDLPSGSHGMGSAAISTSKSLAKLFGVLMYSVLFTYFLQSSEIETVTESVRAYQYTFFAGAVLAAILTILMLTLKSGRK